MDSACFSRATLVFDLDGTLVDTAPDLVRALNHVLASADCAPRPAEEVRPFISFGARRMIVEGLAASGSPRDAAKVDELFAVFLEHYTANVAVESRPYPGVPEFLETAETAGARMAVCTNKYESLSNRLLTELGIRHLFHAIAGRDTFPVSKPDPGHLTGAIDLAGGTKNRAVMIGDSGTDVKTAKAAGIPVIVVDFGYSEIPAQELGADLVINHYDRLADALNGLIPKG